LSVALEAIGRTTQILQRLLRDMPKWRMSQVVRQSSRLRNINIDRAAWQTTAGFRHVGAEVEVLSDPPA